MKTEALIPSYTISNTREGGLQLRLFQWKSTEPLKDGKFTLTDSSGQTVGNYTSDGSGTITILYNFDRNSLYTLRQTAAPRGYVGLSIPITDSLSKKMTVISIP